MTRVYNQPRSMRGKARMLKPFAGVDGEGGDINGSHEYLLLRAGNYALETGNPLGTYECLAFLANLPTDVIYVSFAFDYDVTMMIRHLHPSKVEKLFDRSSRVIMGKDGKPTSRYYPVEVGHGEYEIDYMPHKEFRVRRKGGKWVVISDVFTFFQSSFVRALQKWFGDDPALAPVIERIAEGKAQRNSFGAVTQDEREYNLLEIRMLERLMERFRAMCTELDIHPSKWQGPGNLVTAVFKREGLPSKKDNRIPWDVWMFAVTGYYGGRFEAGTYGHITGPVYQYDINSAYASHYKNLPCLVHGEWMPLDAGRLPNDGIYVADVSFRHRKETHWYTLPVRTKKGTLAFPREGRGVYWMHELHVAAKHAEVTVNGGWRYVKRCECRWFDWVYALYDERDRVGKDSGKGKVLKIVLATIYGKLAQSKGQPLYANPVWSGLVVSYCRATLISAALQVDGGSDVYMLATDGLFCGNPRNVTVGRNLGEWSETVHSEMFIVQSGVYFVPGEKPKTRGVPQSRVIQYERVFRFAWWRWVLNGPDFATPPNIKIPLRVFIAARLARARGKPWEAGKWKGVKKRVAFDWTTKRANPVLSGGAVTTLPVEGGPWFISESPKYAVGGDFDPESLLDADQPDWGQKFLNDDDVL